MKKILILLAFALVLPLSCQSEKTTTVTTQESNIDTYIKNSHSEKEIYRNGGSNRIVLALGEGDSIVVGDNATLALKGYVFTNSPGNQFCEDTVSAVIGSGYFIPGLDNGLVGAKMGEQCYVVFSAKYGFYDKAVGIVPSMSALLYDVTVLDIVKAN